MTSQTRLDEPEEAGPKDGLGRLWSLFAVTAVIVVVAGWALTRAAESVR